MSTEQEDNLAEELVIDTWYIVQSEGEYRATKSPMPADERLIGFRLPDFGPMSEQLADIVLNVYITASLRGWNAAMARRRADATDEALPPSEGPTDEREVV